MGGERAATTRQREIGKICAICHVNMPPPADQPAWVAPGGERLCLDCLRNRAFRAGRPYEVILNFQLRDAWQVHFIAPDCNTPISRFFNLPSQQALRDLVFRTEPHHQQLEAFEYSMRVWSRGSVNLHLTPAQFLRLCRGRNTLLRQKK